MAYLFIAISIVILYWRAHTFRPQGIASLTSLRAFAAAIVFFLHYSDYYRADHPGVLSTLLRGGYEGVSVFFVLSGFLLTTSLLRDLKTASFDLWRYFIRRAARIYPLYFALLCMVYVVSPYFVHWQSLFLLQGFFPSVVFTGIPPAWTLTVEESFYFLLPAVILLCLKIGKSSGLALACLALMALGFALLALNLPDLIGSVQFMWSHTIFGRFPVFAIGIACAFLYERRKQYPIALLVVSAPLFVLFTCLSAVESEHPDFRLADMFVALAAGAIVLGLASDHRLTRFIGNRYFAYIGVISYALYLVQLTPFIGWLVPLTHSLPDLVAAYAIVTLCAMACYELIERPARAYILQRVGRRTPKSVVLPIKALSGNKPDAF